MQKGGVPLKNLSSEEKEIVRKQFYTYCIKVLHGEELNYFKELEKKKNREINFSELFQKEPNILCNHDEFAIAEHFTVMGLQVSVYDECISAALRKLPDKKRNIILMLFFLDMTETEIAVYLQLVQSTVHYHKADSLRLLKILLERNRK